MAGRVLHALAVGFGPDLAIRAIREMLEVFEDSRPRLLQMHKAARLEVEVLDGLQRLPVKASRD